MRVLIVDDNASMRTLLSVLLSSQGYEVVGTLPDGNGVMEAIRKMSPDIVCLDYRLPGRDGLDILQEINSTLPEIDVLFMTASEGPGIEEQAADAGAAGFLRKPFSQKQVINELRQVCQTRRQASRANLPEAAPKSPDTGQGDAKPAKDSIGPRPTVVIADDNSSVRLLLKGVLSELGLHIVGQAGNGEEAIRAAMTHQPNVLFLDVNMPILSGLEALPRILEASPETAVVMVTGDTSRTIVQQAAGLGARGYIVKPVRPAYVEKFLKELFKR
ncbi:MAG: Response regulator receiver [Proteobacteria bacterium]|nr:Response regulator receiver [Pseudomonadota bacterium]